jgi:transcription elongation factor Elf1
MTEFEWNDYIYCPQCGDEDPSLESEQRTFLGQSISCRSCSYWFRSEWQETIDGDLKFKPIAKGE